MDVIKSGGTSLGNADAIRQSCKIGISHLGKSRPGLIHVVSAVGKDKHNNTKVTDALENLANLAYNNEGCNSQYEWLFKRHDKIMSDLKLSERILHSYLKEIERRIEKPLRNKEQHLALMKSFGERMSKEMVAAQYRAMGIDAIALDTWDIGMVTDSDFNNAKILPGTYDKIKAHLGNLKQQVIVVAGYAHKDKNGRMTVFSRGGTDLDAAIIGAAINADAVYNYTDVDGILTANIPKGKTIKLLSYREAEELAYNKVKLHPDSIAPLKERGIPLVVRNTFNPNCKGTRIEEKSDDSIKGISFVEDSTVLKIYNSTMVGKAGFAAEVFGVFAQYKISIGCIADSMASITVIPENNGKLEEAIGALRRKKYQVQAKENRTWLSIVGEGMQHYIGTSAMATRALADTSVNIEVQSQPLEEICMNYVVDGKDGKNALIALHEEFFE